MTLLVVIWFVNLGISVWNSYAVGNAWVEAKHAGGRYRFMAWMGAVMADIGFTWCFLVLFGLVANMSGHLNNYSFEVLMNAGYLVIIFPLLFAGYAITLDSWQRAYRERTLASAGVAGWNTFASIHNTYNAASNVGDAFKMVFDALLGGKRRRGKEEVQVMLILFILIFSIGLGTVVTWALINRFAGRDEPLPLRGAYQGV